MVPFFRRKRRDPSNLRKEPPFPWQQLLVLALCRLCEPIAFMSIFPYIYFMVKSFNITNDERQIAIYAGMVTSAFTFGEFATGVFWGRISDRVGRKYVLLMGMFGTGLSMILFGFSRSLPMALCARALGGLLNGNIGVLQTAVAEVVTVKEHQARAYSIMPFIWCIGSIIGSGLGGTLADPVRSYPAVFTSGSIWDKYPYLLPNLFCLSFVVFGLVVGFLFLQETHEEKKHRQDVGVKIGQWILRQIGLCGQSDDISDKDGTLDETLSFLADEENLSGYSSSGSDVDSDDPEIASARSRTRTPRPSVRQTFSRQVVLNIVGYGILAFHTISFEQLLLVLLASPLPQAPPTLPFKFEGGFALTSKEIGYVLSVQGFLQMLAQLILFPIINRKLGSLITFRIVILAYPILYMLTPYLVLLPPTFRMPCIYLVVVWKVIAQSLSYPSAAIMLANLAPSKKVLGTLNGVAASSATLCRTAGPLFSGAIQSTGATLGYSGLSWWACALVAAAGATECMFMKEEKQKGADGSRMEGQPEDICDGFPTESDSEVTIYDDDRMGGSDDNSTLCNSPLSRASQHNSNFSKDDDTESLIDLHDDTESLIDLHD